jgi:hypothetical protein
MSDIDKATTSFHERALPTLAARHEPIHLADIRPRPRPAFLQAWERMRHRQMHWLIECMAEFVRRHSLSPTLFLRDLAMRTNVLRPCRLGSSCTVTPVRLRSKGVLVGLYFEPRFATGMGAQAAFNLGNLAQIPGLGCASSSSLF